MKIGEVRSGVRAATPVLVFLTNYRDPSGKMGLRWGIIQVVHKDNLSHAYR